MVPRVDVITLAAAARFTLVRNTDTLVREENLSLASVPVPVPVPVPVAVESTNGVPPRATAPVSEHSLLALPTVSSR
tara:strand:- start:183 stop:413 length:231 start_codon:yes stop_codon:yes gene_type:complete